jgi:hypothetical protein
MKDQCGALCRWTLAEDYFLTVGDGKLAREKYLSFLEYVDQDISMVTAAPPLREVMEDMYMNACYSMAQLSLSYDEYFQYMNKIKTVRPLTTLQSNELAATRSALDHAGSWCGQILQLADTYSKNAESGSKSGLGGAAAMYSLILSYPEVETSTTELLASINNYAVSVGELILGSVSPLSAPNIPIDPNNYIFILDRATDLIKEYLEDLETKDAALKALDILNTIRPSIYISNFADNHYDSTAPPDAPDFIPPLVLKKRYQTYLTRPMADSNLNNGCSISIGLLFLAALITVIYRIFTYFFPN